MPDEPFGLSTIGQVLVPVTDVARATAFYRDQLGMRFLFEYPGMAFFDAGGVRLYLAEPEAPDFRGVATIYYRVPDLDDGGRDARGAGRRVHGAAPPRPPRRHQPAVDGVHDGSRREQRRPDERDPGRGPTPA